MLGRLRTASSPSRIVMDWAPYSVCCFFLWAATIGRVSLGLTGARCCHRDRIRSQSTVTNPRHRLSSGVSTQLIDTCTKYLEHPCVLTPATPSGHFQRALSRIATRTYHGVPVPRYAGAPCATTASPDP